MLFMFNRLPDPVKLLCSPRDFFRSCCGALLAFLLASGAAAAQSGLDVDRSADNLMVALRESMGGVNKQDETLRPMSRLRAKLSDGKEIDVELVAFEFLGDMHIRLVFDGPSYMSNAKPQDL